ncbi:MAG: sigma-54-dependent Fis family transcriptional regulator, partial [Campylobacteraceae bacterium]|nr:sigma-54-dependent Fis family transcriptional regulator [Campylobacteraceae bacterium]
ALKSIDNSFDMVISDLTMPVMDGLEFVKELDGRFPVIIITGNATLNRAIDSIRLGVKDFITKPFEIQTLINAIKNGIEEKQPQPQIQKPKKEEIKTEIKDGFIVISKGVERAVEVARKAATTDASIMLLGESGVGKEVFANFIHKNSHRSDKPFVAINMAAIPDNLIESELFGYEKGAFTDAQAAKPGRFELANGGTLFLDEIAEMPYPLQSKLLRVLQDREITRLGGIKPIKIDVRIISATNVNIDKNIKEGLFREDLYYRLNTIPIKIPPLRERQEEIIPIAEATLSNTAKKYGVKEHRLSEGAKESLLKYEWPGNIRELISVCERVSILTDSDTIEAEDILQNL